METLRILVVDDEPGMRAGAVRALRDFAVRLPELDREVRFRLEEAHTGEQALQAVASAPPDLMLLDHKLPGLSGLDVLGQVAPQVPQMLVVMITAYASLEAAVAATKRGAYDFLAKPFTPEELREAVRKAARHLVLQRQAQRLAEEKRRVRFAFISVLAHELKAPIAAIQGYLSILRDRTAGEDPAVQRHMIERSLIRLGGMRKLIGDLLDLTRIESGQKQRELAELDLADVARCCLQTAQPEADAAAVALHLHAPAPVGLLADRGEMEIVLNNLLSNAVKYNRRGGRVDVSIAADGPAAIVEVADTGIGMTPQEASRLFRDFVRIRNDKTRDILGSGLGLSIVRKIAALYDGEARVASQPDAGSTFTVTLSRRPSGPEPA